MRFRQWSGAPRAMGVGSGGGAAAAAGALVRGGRGSRRSCSSRAEPEFAFDRAGNVIGVEPVTQTESHRLIEYLMIAANEQVARFLEAQAARAVPGTRATRAARRSSG